MSPAFCESWRHPVTLGSDIGYGVLSFLSQGGSAGTIAAQNRNYLVCGLTILGNETANALDAANRELSQLCLYAQQTRYAVDYLMAQQGAGGVCTVIKDLCVTNVKDESYNISHSIYNIRSYVEEMNERPSGWWPFNFLGNFWGSLVHYGIIFLIIVVVTLILCCLLPLCKDCLITRAL